LCRIVDLGSRKIEAGRRALRKRFAGRVFARQV
jgi:hypothetical protein